MSEGLPWYHKHPAMWGAISALLVIVGTFAVCAFVAFVWVRPAWGIWAVPVMSVVGFVIGRWTTRQ